MAPHLADAPFFWRVAIKRLFFPDAAQERKSLIDLALQLAENVIAGNAVDVAEIIRRSFIGFGAAGYGSNHENNGSSVGRMKHRLIARIDLCGADNSCPISLSLSQYYPISVTSVNQWSGVLLCALCGRLLLFRIIRDGERACVFDRRS